MNPTPHAMIGGEHHLPAPEAVADSLADMLEAALGDSSFFSTGRDALACLLTNLPEASVWLPDLICASVHDACVAGGKLRRIYAVGPDFLHDASFDPGLHPPAIVFVMHYFGICNDDLMRLSKAGGATVVSDVTHLLFDRAGLERIAAGSDYLIASLRKSGPFPDGGFVSSRTHRTVEPTLDIRESFFLRRAAGLLARGFSAAGGFRDDENFLLLKQAETLLDASTPAAHRCSHLSRQLAQTIPVASTAEQMRRNLAVLRNGLHDVCAVPPQDDLVSPYFPCIFRDRGERDAVRAGLGAERCHFPVHWPSTDLPVASPLADLCLSIPCDARYDEDAMRHVTEVIRSCLFC